MYSREYIEILGTQNALYFEIMRVILAVETSWANSYIRVWLDVILLWFAKYFNLLKLFYGHFEGHGRHS